MRFDPRRNSFDALRLLLAGLVAVDHGAILRSGEVQTHRGAGLGDYAVDGFFVISGFLVTSSYLRLSSLARFVWHRALRILPGFWVCLLMTALVAAPLIAVLEGKPAASVFSTAPTAVDYVVRNAFLLMRQFGIADLLADNPTPTTLDGSLWTLFYEAVCYALVAGLGVVGVLVRRRWLVLVLTGAVWALTITNAAGVTDFASLGSRLALMFLLGALAHLYLDRLPTGPGWLLAAVLVFVVAMVWAEPYRVLGAAAFAFLLVQAAVRSPFAFHLRTDLSYGLYIYHFLVFQVLVLTPVGLLPVAPFIALGIAVSLVVAGGSWFLVERPAMAHKGAGFVSVVERALGTARRRAAALD